MNGIIASRSPDDNDDERAPLISSTQHTTPINDSPTLGWIRPPTPATPPSARSHPRDGLGIIAICIGLIILIELGAYLATIPLNQVLEENICRSIYRDLLEDGHGGDHRDDPRCKDKAVQAELSLIRGWQSTLDFIPGLLTAVPYGFLADKRGRELTLSLSMLGITLSSASYILVCAVPRVFPPRVSWASAVFTFIGGGPAVFNAMIFTIAGDVVKEEQRATTFSYLSAAVVGGELLASPLVYLLMQVDLWLCIYTGLGCLVLGTVITFLLPETLAPNKPIPSSLSTDSEVPNRNPNSTWYRTMWTETQMLVQAVSWVAWRNWRVTLLLVTLLMTTVGRFAQELLLQYVTNRYGWSWSQASLLLSVKAFSNLALLTVLLPSVIYLLMNKLSRTAEGANLFLARASAILLAAGAVIIGLSLTSVLMAVGLGIFALGSGYNFLIRSLLASVVPSHNIGMLYTVISICETIGVLIAGPLVAMSFRTGLDWGGAWIGLPYLVSGCLCAVAATAVSMVGLSGLSGSRSGRTVDGEPESSVSE